jgi:peptidoglycan DL-endopeptidase CwlO
LSIADVMDRMQMLRVQLGMVPKPTSTSGTSGTAFASALADASSTVDGVDGTGTGADAVTSAEKYLGVPYVFGSNNPTKGLDCSGLVQRAYADLGITLPRVASDQAKVGQPVASLADAKPGDLLAFHTPVSHIAIYVGDGMMIAAPHTGDHVKIQKVYDTPTAIRRVLPDAGTGTMSAAIMPALRPASLQSAGSGATPYADLFKQAAAKHGISPALLAAVAKVESGYNPRAVSPAGAQGMMQLMPSTAAGMGVNPFDPAQAVDGAARILSNNLKDFGSLQLAIAAYNAGGGAVRKYGGIPPYAETQAYVPKVLAAMSALDNGGTPL